MEVSLDTKLEQRFLAKFFFEYYTFQIPKVSLFITNIHCSPRSIKTKFINSWRDIENFDHVVAIQQIPFFFFLQERKIFKSNSESNSSANITVLCNLVPYQPRRGFANLANVIYLTAYFCSRLPRNKATERHYSRGTIRTHASSRSLSLLHSPVPALFCFCPLVLYFKGIQNLLFYIRCRTEMEMGMGNEQRVERGK